MRSCKVSYESGLTAEKIMLSRLGEGTRRDARVISSARPARASLAQVSSSSARHARPPLVDRHRLAPPQPRLQSAIDAALHVLPARLAQVGRQPLHLVAGVVQRIDHHHAAGRAQPPTDRAPERRAGAEVPVPLVGKAAKAKNARSTDVGRLCVGSRARPDAHSSTITSNGPDTSSGALPSTTLPCRKCRMHSGSPQVLGLFYPWQ